MRGIVFRRDRVLEPMAFRDPTADVEPRHAGSHRFKLPFTGH
jgi:hypothetical protein